MGRLDGKVAFVTGAARGQGRSHALHLAREGADIIAVDICEDVESVPYALATKADLDETVRAVEALGRRIFATKADVRDLARLEQAVQAGVAELGRLDVVVANAGICTIAPALEIEPLMWQQMIDINLTGVWHTLKASLPIVREQGEGGSIIVTSSVSGLKAVPQLGHYTSAKHGVVGLARTLAVELGQERIRVNVVCPTNVDTDMIDNDVIRKIFLAHLEHPTREDALDPSSPYHDFHVMPIPWVEASDVSEAVVYLASDAARYVTGITLPIDAGVLIK
ncbi:MULTISPECIES: mycofactocin-coupled SDR family oxidoreductase [Amycolatopsis]|uniref:SDR family mycofactocin-dependent oxidoreductase n=2 Tax=Amycolatopsis TaxID=1813 RepID=A0A1I3KCS6_9PSEU|nr:mycofactocin-coupled SDR family oxidoreductase [Amycolatopsis sacchari]SFI70316.1 SDR family mycofactocin-dependent oxidoreductase [Amycolatopsis sacchari]